MASKYKDKDTGVVLNFSGRWVSWVHTTTAYAAFLSALVIGVSLHYHKIVQNQFYGYPQEWFPSVSATIGDRYPERSFFMFFIAITSGPRFALVGLWYLLTRNSGPRLPAFVAVMGVFRTLTCGGWTFITSTDDHDWHDILMISYLVATLPWTTGCIAVSPPNPRAIKYRKYLATAFFSTLVPMIYFFIQHKVHRVAGAYTTYAFFEWSLILFDVAFDAVTVLDFDTFEVTVRDVKGSGNGVMRHSSPPPVLQKEKENATGGIFAFRFTWSQALDIAANIYHGFIFWSILTSLGVLVWFFPLWYMGISGYEVLVLTSASPSLLAIRPVRSFVLNNLQIVHLLSLVGIAAYLVENPVARLFAVGFGVVMACLGWVGTLYTESVHDGRLETKILGWMVGLIMSSAVKYAWWTNNPIWPIMNAENGGWNGTGLFLGILAVLRFTRQAPLTIGTYTSPTTSESSWLASVGIGGLFFGLHSLLSDSSTMILWVWEGYPIRGPFSATHGWLTLGAMSLGLFGGLCNPNAAGSWLVFLVGSAGAATVTYLSHWSGYSGALAVAAYLMAFSVPMLSHAAKMNPARTFGLGFMIYNFLVLFHVWVVAYAFVPGGHLVREHTDWVMMSMMVSIGAGVYGINSSILHRQQPKRTPATQQRRYFAVSTLLVNIFFLCAAFKRFPTNNYRSYHPEDRIITAGIWTIHFSLDNDMWSSEYRIRDLVKELELDVIGLLETDNQRIIMGNRDTTQFLAEELGMYVDYGPGPNKHTWGAALLSKFPIVESKHHLLPSPVGELAPAIHATLNVYGQLVDVFVFHSGQEEDPEDRRLQSLYLADLMGSSPRPAFLLSYLVTEPLEGNYNTYVSEKSGMHDVDPSDWDRWCEYILYKRLKRVGYARVSRGSVTDTELQVAKFRVPESRAEIAKLEALPEKDRNRRVEEDDVPEGWRFPAMFRGKGIRDHKYHVFDEPRYFNDA
ncbi:Frag1/DRAM/Sfk1 family-domain-containing protein [Dactylonectria estremocensis]|uniref:Frag1/DRAM/Sfk1 family-domain-containing protein n=1 Tax=Dactylonectria estremocensis TaxID=1079267 RepID=A0A9P9JEG4_9HYPO|nr:Frag1/DRAM/Sfk1 family-domain-containing protein [Dactylonectria estremocensis]